MGEHRTPGSREPSGAGRVPDPDDPATWVRPVACDGHDRHPLTIPWQRAVATGAAGGVLIAVDVHWHLYGRSLGVGIGLLLVPMFAALFARWVDGPTLCYRSWGRLRRLDLTSVTAVGVGKRVDRGRSVTLSAPGLRKPLRVALRDPRYAVPPLAREHLRRWLTSPRVEWDPGAAVLFAGGAAGGMPRRARLATALVVVGSVCVVAIGLWVVLERTPHPTIAGAPGYRTYSGPHGKVLAVGRPWGAACRPVRFTVDAHVPNWIYAQAAAVVAEARHDGIDVTVETRRFMWNPASLYYASGQTPATTVRVPIFVKGGTPPRRHDGKPEHINLGWDARVDEGGNHEAVTYLQGTLFTQAIGDDALSVRRSVRQLIAMTQGVIESDRSDSGIAKDSSVDRFSAADLAAMKLMSGCAKVARSAAPA